MCGSVRYAGEGDPVFMGNCHCADCRKSSASGHMALLAVPAAGMDVNGEVSTYEMSADSGATVTHNFCPNCGSPMFNTNSTMPGVIVFVASSLDDPEIYKPAVTVYASRALSWDQPDAYTKQFEKMPPMGG